MQKMILSKISAETMLLLAGYFYFRRMIFGLKVIQKIMDSARLNILLILVIVVNDIITSSNTKKKRKRNENKPSNEFLFFFFCLTLNYKLFFFFTSRFEFCRGFRFFMRPQIFFSLFFLFFL